MRAREGWIGGLMRLLFPRVREPADGAVASGAVVPGIDWNPDRTKLLVRHVAACIAGAPSDIFLRLDTFVRQPRVGWYLRERPEIPPLPIFIELAGEKEPSPASLDLPTLILGLSSMHPDGRIRQQFVEALARSGKAQALPFLLVRTGDWVPQVSGPARDAIRDRVSESPALFVAYTGLVAALATSERSDAALLTAIQSALGTAPAALLQAFGKLPARDRYALLTFSADRRWLCSEALARLALPDRSDIKGRMLAARIILEAETGTSHASMLALTQDKSSQIATLGLDACYRSDVNGLREILTRALFHSSLAVSSLAGTLLRRRFDQDPAEILRYELDLPAGRHTRALKALSVFGGPADIPLAEHFLQSPNATLRAIAFRLIATKAPIENLGLLLDNVTSPQQTLRRIAHGALRKNVSQVDPSLLLPFLHDDDPAVARSIFGMLFSRDRWTPLTVIALAYGIATIRAEAEPAFQKWLARLTRYGGGRPDRSDAAKIEAALGVSGDAVPARTRLIIRQIIA